MDVVIAKVEVAEFSSVPTFCTSATNLLTALEIQTSHESQLVDALLIAIRIASFVTEPRLHQHAIEIGVAEAIADAFDKYCVVPLNVLAIYCSVEILYTVRVSSLLTDGIVITRFAATFRESPENSTKLLDAKNELLVELASDVNSEMLAAEYSIFTRTMLSHSA